MKKSASKKYKEYKTELGTFAMMERFKHTKRLVFVNIPSQTIVLQID